MNKTALHFEGVDESPTVTRVEILVKLCKGATCYSEEKMTEILAEQVDSSISTLVEVIVTESFVDFGSYD